MDLHDHAVLDAHGRHLGQHLGAEQLRILGGRASPVDTRRNSASASAVDRSAVLARRMAVIGRGRAILTEERAALAMRVEIAAPGSGVASGQLAKAREIVAESLRIPDRRPGRADRP